MQAILIAGLVISLLGAPAIMLSLKGFRIDSLSLPSRLALWLLALVVLALAAYGSESWRTQLGLQAPTTVHLGVAALAIFGILAVLPLLQFVQKVLGGTSIKQTEQFRKLADLSFNFRLFLVITAAVVEEILYRGYAIGIGKDILGSPSVAVIVSLTLFVAIHFRWGLTHLLSVLFMGLILSLLFVLTNDLWACVVVHSAVDAFGLLFLPVAMRRKKLARPESSG